MVVRDGLIEAVGANVAVPADAWVIEGDGLTVYPGLIDALSTLGIPQPATPQRNGELEAEARPQLLRLRSTGESSGAWTRGSAHDHKLAAGRGPGEAHGPALELRTRGRIHHRDHVSDARHFRRPGRNRGPGGREIRPDGGRRVTSANT